MKITTLTMLLFVLALLGFGTSAYHQEPQAPNVTNQTSAIEVVSLTQSDPRARPGRGYGLVLKNISEKSINGYSVGFGKGAGVTTDLTSAHRLIAPGDQFTVQLPDATNITIRYILFSDGSMEGDAIAAGELLDRREGMRQQLEHIVPLLSAAAISGDLEQLRTDLEALPEEAVPSLSVYVNLGLRNVKEDTLLDLEKLDKANLAEGLARLTEQHNKRRIRLAKAVK